MRTAQVAPAARATMTVVAPPKELWTVCTECRGGRRTEGGLWMKDIRLLDLGKEKESNREQKQRFWRK